MYLDFHLPTTALTDCLLCFVPRISPSRRHQSSCCWGFPSRLRRLALTDARLVVSCGRKSWREPSSDPRHHRDLHPENPFKRFISLHHHLKSIFIATSPDLRHQFTCRSRLPIETLLLQFCLVDLHGEGFETSARTRQHRHLPAITSSIARSFNASVARLESNTRKWRSTSTGHR